MTAKHIECVVGCRQGTSTGRKLRAKPDSTSGTSRGTCFKPPGRLTDIHWVTDLIVKPWNRYGNRRLYVSLPDGTRVGWVDLTTDERHLELSEFAQDFERAVSPLVGEAASLVVQDPAEVPQARSVAVVDEPENRDLSLHRPGELVGARAQAEWEAAKDELGVLAWGQRLIGSKTEERNWRVGAQGEVTVGSKLEKLCKRGWRVLHSVPVGTRGSDIDHVLIGPGGVFTLNTKRHPQSSVWVRGNTVKVNGHNQPYVRNSRFEMERAARLLSEAAGRPVPVTGALVFLTGTMPPKVTVREQPDEVLVLDLQTLLPAYKRRKGIWTADEVDALFEIARWSRVWQPTS